MVDGDASHQRGTKTTKINSGRGFALDPTIGRLQRSPDPLSDYGLSTS